MNRVEIEIGARLTLRGLPRSVAVKFVEENSFANPKRTRLEALGKWCGREPATIELWSASGDALTLPRGYLPSVIAKIRQSELQFTVKDATIAPLLPEKLEARGQLYPLQQKALESLLRYSTGVCEAPTGSGKTNVLLSAVARLGTPALILVHTTELLNQTCERARSWLNTEPGIIQGARRDLRPVTVAMIQTLSRCDTPGMAAIARHFGAVMVDECHHSPASTWAAILEQLPCRFKYGFSATTWRKDGMGFLMSRLIGLVSAKITKRECEAAGKIVWPSMEVVETPYYFHISSADQWGGMITDLSRDPDRNALICREVRRRMTPDTKALALTDRIEHANRLAGMLADLQPVLLTGDCTKRDREAGMQLVRDGARLTVATVHLLGEGVDIPGWGLLFLASPFAGGPRVLQAIGRVSRPAPGKARATVIDFVDVRIPMLVNAARSRQRLYEGVA